MHKLLDYINTELEDLESKADRDGSLTMSEIQYADTLLHMKKNLLKSEEMSDDYSYRSYRGRKRDARGRYSAREDMTDQMRDMMKDAPDEQTRQEFQRFISKLERM